MKIYISLCKSLIKKNVGLIIGLFVMSVLTIVIGVLGLNISTSAKTSIADFIEDSNLPDKLYTTRVYSTSLVDELKEIEGIESLDSRFFSDVHYEAEGKGVFPGNIITYDENVLTKITFTEKIDISKNEIRAYVPIRFSKSHNIKCGDKLTLYVGNISINSIVAGIITSPETLQVAGDFMSFGEGFSHTSIYLNYSDVKSTLDIDGKSNQWLFYFNENLSESEKAETISKIDKIFGEGILSVRDFNGAKNGLLTYKKNIESVNVLGEFFAFLIALITLGFNFIFIQIIVKKEKKTIGLMKALGYQKKQIVILFCLLTCLINVPAVLVGFPMGYLMIRLTLLGMQSNFGIPLSTVIISTFSILGLTLATFLIGIVSCVMTSTQISKIEPCDIYEKNNDLSKEPVKIISCFRKSKFFKIVLTSTFRNIGRQIVGALCISACVLFAFVSIEGYASNMRVRTGVYGERFLYDVAIRNVDETDYQQMATWFDDVEIIEPNIFINASTDCGTKIITAMKDNCELIKLYDGNHKLLIPKDGVIIDQFTADKHGKKVGDYIVINNCKIQIEGIAIEYTYPASYVSFETAKKLGGEINGVMIKLKNGRSVAQFTKDVFEFNGDAYVVRIDDQYSYLNEQYLPISVALLMLGTLSFLIGALLVANISFIDFLELKSKYATLRALGCPMKKISTISLFENTLRCIVGCLIALPASYFFGNLLFKLLNTSSVYYAMTRFFTYYLISAGICLIYIIISVLITYIEVKKMDFAHCLNGYE